MQYCWPSGFSQLVTQPPPEGQIVYTTTSGACVHTDSLSFLRTVHDNSVQLILTSPPFPLVTPKPYGNRTGDEFIAWFMEFVSEFRRVIKHDGSIVIDLGSTYIAGRPVKSVYQYEILTRACKEYGLVLAQEFFHYNPSRMPAPIEWVNRQRIRVKDAVNVVWWLAKTDYPKADNRMVLKSYSESMRHVLRTKKLFLGKRPSGHNVSKYFVNNNGGAIPPNLLSVSNGESNSRYMQVLKKSGKMPHPARFPKRFASFFVDFLTDVRDVVLDPFAGANTTGLVCEERGRRWVSCELNRGYAEDSLVRFQHPPLRPSLLR